MIGSDFFSTPIRTVFGVVVIYVDFDGEKKTIKHKYFDIVSSCLSHGSYFVTSALDRVLDNEFFDNFDTLKIWSDNAKNLKSYELASFFYNLSTKKTVSWNFFTQYHGKSICDCRFAWISSAF